MREFLPSLLVLVLLCASTGIGFLVNARLPERHRSRESVEMIQLAIGLMVTFTAIVLGLLTSSVKSGFETAYQARGTYAGQIAQLDRCLRDYGPETDATRARLRSYVAAVIASTWPDEAPPPGATYPDTSKMRQVGEDPTLSEIMNQVGLDVRALKPADVFHQNMANACMSDYADTIRSRWAVIEGEHGSIATPFYWVLVFWLVLLFASFGLRARPNLLSVIVIGLCAVSVSSAVFVIRDLDLPYGGLFGVPSDSMRDALADMSR
ncbi:MAG: hypothetical protein E7774_03955 [Bradyrhizobium sp.]|nr:MAG: hypothetical protein E7774_03955 [Bradyrhizobium sp.]